MLADFITSRFRGRPVELYRFTYGPRDQDVFLYTDGENPITYMGETYTPIPIQRGATSNTGTMDKTALDITLPHLAKVPQLFRVYPPSSTVGLTILQGQLGDPDNQFVSVWAGRIISVAFEGIEAKLSGEPITTTWRRSGLRRNYQYMCPHILYGPMCRASKIAATSAVVIHAVSGRKVTLTSTLTDAVKYASGVLEWTAPDGRFEVRTILTVQLEAGRTILNLTGIASDLAAGATAAAVRGCRHTIAACRDDHNNAVNFGGQPWIPTKNPIGNSSPFQ